MDVFQAFVLGIVQGITEWLPISSSGHLVIMQDLLGLEPEENLVFDLVVHLGTLTAVLAFFRKELGRIVLAVFTRKALVGPQESALRLLAGLLIVGTIPAGVAGVLFSGSIEKVFDLRLVGLALIANACLLFVFERVGSEGTRRSARLLDAVIIGLFQAIAIIPGISRSGSTIGGGMLRGLERETAAVFAFLLSVPTLLGAFVFGALTLENSQASLGPLVVGFVVAFAIGLASIEYLLKAVKSKKLWVFAVYCVAVGAAVVLFTL
jgi:undecaprenyl-diphosphatase